MTSLLRIFLSLFFLIHCSVVYSQTNDSIVPIPKDQLWGWHREFYCSAGIGLGFENSFHSSDLITKYKFGFSYKQTRCYSIAYDPMSYLIWMDTKQGNLYKIGASVNFYLSTPKPHKITEKYRWSKFYLEHLVLEVGLGLKKVKDDFFPMLRFSPKINYTIIRFEGIDSYINVLPFYSLDINYNSKLRFDNSIGMKFVWQIGFW